MKRLHMQYAAYRRNGFNRRDTARLALRDCGIKTFRLGKTGNYHHSTHNWNWRT